MEYIAVYTANTLAIVLIIVMYYVARNKLFVEKNEIKSLYLLGTMILISAFIEPFIWYADGHDGVFWWFCLHILNAYQFFAYPAITFVWLIFLLYHLKFYVSYKKILLIAIPLFISLFGLIINAIPGLEFVFIVDDKLIYHRLWGFSLYFIICFGYLFASLIVYWIVNFRSGGLNFFPVWLFVATVIIGSIINFTLLNIPNFPTISLIMPFAAIGYTGVISSIQNETIYRDKLTGLYNRTFIDYYLKKKKNKKFVGLVLNINEFKQINETFGLAIGNQALEDFSFCLNIALAKKGVVIRNSGDEFIIFLNTMDLDEAHEIMKRVKTFIEINKKEKLCPYDITFTYGCSIYDPLNGNFDTFLSYILDDMYVYKKKYYDEHKKLR